MESYEREIKYLTDLYDSIPSDEEIDFPEEPESDLEDLFSNHSTDTEQENASDLDDVHGLEEQTEDEPDRRLYYFGKDGKKWRKFVSTRNIRTRQENIISHLPGAISEGKKAITSVDSWNLIFDNIVNLVVSYTNLYIQKVFENYKDQYDVRLTSKEEMKAFLGLLYLSRIEKG
ncbi:hypothetical protein ABEB36_015103 [Hypothenemus hampei]|uniref:PiggyBac transposable element-derived protein domain-containing protein n=1 Tax=Hypothenemus hampei TaxID=57062 RepID=A0ABD1E0P0_HYPHA